MEKKKTIVLTMIGLATLMLLVIGSAFAYFSITNNSGGKTETNFTGETDELAKYGTPTITGESELYLDLLVTDMSQGKIGTSYWATAEKVNRFEPERTDHIVSTAGISGSDTEEEAYLNCTSDLTITASVKKSGEEEPLEEDIITEGDGRVYLGYQSDKTGNKATINPNEIDLATIISETKSNKGYKTTVNYTIVGDSSVNITAAIELKNTKDDQTALAGKDIDINITNENLVCSVRNKTNADIAEENDKTDILTDTSVGGMHRYQGTGDVNNYICLGSECSENGKDLYRIIGITDDGEIKVIKKTALTSKWHTDDIDIEWPDSDLFHQLNDYAESEYGSHTYDSTSFYSKLSEQLKPYIVKKDWMYGDTNLEYDSADMYNGNKVYAIETGGEPTTHRVKNENNYNYTEQPYTWSKKVSAYIGLQYIHDYIYAYPGGEPGNYTTAKNAWIYFSKNDNSNYYSEFLISRYGYFYSKSGYVSSHGYESLAVYLSDGCVNISALTYTGAVRPVFYLSSDVSLSGEGTLNTPYTIF